MLAKPASCFSAADASQVRLAAAKKTPKIAAEKRVILTVSLPQQRSCLLPGRPEQSTAIILDAGHGAYCCRFMPKAKMQNLEHIDRGNEQQSSASAPVVRLAACITRIPASDACQNPTGPCSCGSSCSSRTFNSPRIGQPASTAFT
jgi:hypothetical protein